MENNSCKTALISMPTLGAHMPSYQLGLLKPTLELTGISAHNFSFYVYFSAFIGSKLNDTLAALRPCIAGEWIWSKAAFGDFSDTEEYINHYRKDLEEMEKEAGCTIDDLRMVRNQKTFEFLDFCVNQVDWNVFGLIGFSITFQQLTASIALARRLKEKYADIPIVFGGAVFEDDIAEGIFRGCSFVDYIHCGDADKTFPEMIHRLEKGESMAGLPGLLWRKGEEIVFNGRSPNLMDMDSTPVPDYDEYLYARDAGKNTEMPTNRPLEIPLETARGCWWGMKSQCTFCGLNRAGMEFRSKSPENVLHMLRELARKYNCFDFIAIDNIMDAGYIETLFQRLADSHSDMRFRYEVRPYFSRQQLSRLKKGGLSSVQPGIESFSTHLLELMKKKSTAIKNVSFLKWCTYFSIENSYNILYGFPGETEADYVGQMELLDKIFHFQPPQFVVQARPERGSDMFENHARYLEKGLTPAYAYGHIFPPERFDLNGVAYYFSYETRGTIDRELYDGLAAKIKNWQRLWKLGRRPRLEYAKSWETLHVKDTRAGERRKYFFGDNEARLLEFLNEPQSEEAMVKEFGTFAGWVSEALADFMEKELVIHLDDRYLSLVLPVNRDL
ncbi:MAG: RiPP maturation radical SAM protein 1 [bacterium]|nr:RiPP maturation radical SAM protein 1 [bacterium]